MNTTTNHTPVIRIQSLTEQLFGPIRAPRGSVERQLLVARSAFAYGGLVTTLVQVVVWLTIAVLTGHLDSPWWLWTTVPAVAAVAGLSIAGRWRRWWTAPTTGSSTHPHVEPSAPTTAR